MLSLLIFGICRVAKFGCKILERHQTQQWRVCLLSPAAAVDIRGVTGQDFSPMHLLTRTISWTTLARLSICQGNETFRECILSTKIFSPIFCLPARILGLL